MTEEKSIGRRLEYKDLDSLPDVKLKGTKKAYLNQADLAERHNFIKDLILNAVPYAEALHRICVKYGVRPKTATKLYTDANKAIAKGFYETGEDTRLATVVARLEDLYRQAAEAKDLDKQIKIASLQYTDLMKGKRTADAIQAEVKQSVAVPSGPKINVPRPNVED